MASGGNAPTPRPRPEAVAGKSNEIIAIPRLLERLELTGALVTIHAIGCQREIAEAIRARGADYLLALKDNWPTRAEEVRLFFDREPGTRFDAYETTDGDHGRIEVRRHRVCHDVAWLATNRRFPGEPRFPGFAAIGMVESEVERDGRISRAQRYYLTSASLSAAQFARAVRAHWGIENRLHWVLDVVFHDDLMRLRSDDPPTWPRSVTHPSTSSSPSPTRPASKSDRRPSNEKTPISKTPSLYDGHEPQAIPLRSPEQ